ncbi:amidohydrolase family protein [Hyphomonas johnsonii]|uniref:Amidohydrolase family protein n=1 Tax=Hyphomonas johnsonii MHS-2 TaxID=1280950 RepID=A0A059F9T9_9PROT|nr:amidohydrolase family protein [Hyphomonas johnsonii]KCZ87326.1 amidohydrolase family protein [Hyphomonas johnsonii MHS-2]
MSALRLTALIAATVGLALSASAQSLAIVGGKVWTGTSQGTLENGTVIIADGQVVSVGPASAATVPAGALVVDAKGKWVTPGFISAFSRTGMVEVDAEESTDDTSASSSDYSVALDAADGFNPDATAIDVTRIEGITRIVVAPEASSNLFAGQGFITDTSGAVDSDIIRGAFLLVSLGERGASLAGGSRSAAWAQLRAALDDAASYPARYIASNDGTALNRVDAGALRAAATGDELILIEAQKATDLLAIMEFARQNPALRIAIVGADEGWRVAPQLAAAGIPVIVDAFSNLPASFEQLAATSENAARLVDAGVKVAIVNLGDNSHQARLAIQVAGNAVANGMSHEDAMRALTTVPAGIFGMQGLGVIGPGARADVVVWDGDPLEITTSPDDVLIDGVIQSKETRQTELRDRYLKLDEHNRPLAYVKP